MRIHVKLFAILRERAGVAEVTLELSDQSTAAEAARRLQSMYPQIEPYLGRSAFAVNRAYVPGSAALADGDELALIPPVSGG